MNVSKALLKKIISVLLILLGILGFILQTIRAANTGHYIVASFVLLIYFTNQSNILVFVIALLVLLNIKKKWFNKLAFIAFINITITAVVFHIFLVPYFTHLYFIHHLFHTIIPIVYFLFYMLFLETDLKPVHGLMSMIYPLFYFIFVYIFIHPVFGNMISRYYPDEPDMVYVYPFLNPENFDNGFYGVVQLSIFTLLPIAGIASVFLLFIKNYLDQLFNKKNA